ncbi:hypothetical protein [Pinisolibacter aquiterrae]|uniref:hypothetical protein n=1 Tax=Pinisolibacter aquiterrae TaxID=2815579 RepID=UPI001E62A32B|nr:hypothetical protein [Pinisolibacter aquiterrae]MCC8234173.1 hypothetical protein [Pinisolibacter aquiterrae]
MDILAVSTAFLRHCRTGRDLSANTIKAYTQDILVICDGTSPMARIPRPRRRRV